MFSGMFWEMQASPGVLCEIFNFWNKFEIWVNELHKLFQDLPFLKYRPFTPTVFSPIKIPDFCLILRPSSDALKRKRLYFSSLEGAPILGCAI